MDLELLFKRFIDLTDRVLPAIRNPAAQLIYLQLYSRTLAAGQSRCKIPLKELADLTGTSIITVQSALKQLDKMKLINVMKPAAPKATKVYEVFWSQDIQKKSAMQRHPMVVLKESGFGGTTYDNILDRLTPEDQELVEILTDALTFEDEKNLLRMAKESCQPGDDPAKKFRELVVLTRFGPERLRRYGSD